MLRRYVLAVAAATLILCCVCYVQAQQPISKSVPVDSAGATQTSRVIVRPSSPNDIKGWSAYLRALTQQNSQGLNARTPYLYFVPSGTDSNALSGRQRQIVSIKDMAARRLRPGNFIAFAGPDSAATGDSLVLAFKDVEPGWAKGATLLFIGSLADKGRVFAAMQSSAATLRFVDMQNTPSITSRVTDTDIPLSNFLMPPPPAPPAPPPLPGH